MGGQALFSHGWGKLGSNWFFVDDNVRKGSLDPVPFAISSQHDPGRLNNVESVRA